MELKRNYKLSIHRFIDLVAQEGDLTAGFFSQRRALEGTKAHQIVQKSRGEEYQKEVIVKGKFEQSGFTLELEGRIDGLIESSSAITIEEIKTIHGMVPSEWQEAPILHRAQLLCYQALLKENPDKKRQFRLCYYHLDQKKEYFIEEPVDSLFCKETFNNYLDRFFSNLIRREEWIKRRDIWASNCTFPYGEFRRGQRHFSVQSYKAIDEGEILLAQAPTGTGKTMATLFPAIKAIGEGKIQRILYITAKTTGREMAKQALLDITEQAIKPLKVMVLTAKEKLCLSPDSPRCHGEDCLFARGFFDKLRELPWPQENVLSMKEMLQVGRNYEICPFELSMEWALEADVVVGDFNHLFDPLVRLRRFFQQEDKITALIDEAHNLPHRAREMFTVRFSKEDIMGLRRAVKEEQPRLAKALFNLNKCLLHWKKESQNSGDWLVSEDVPDDICQSLQKSVKSMEEIITEPWARNNRQLWQEFYFMAKFFLSLTEQDLSGHCFTIEKKKWTTFTLRCLDPAPNLIEPLDYCHGVILFSATLNPMDYYGRVLLGERSYRSVSIASPFSEKNCLILNRRDISTRYKDRERNLPAILEALKQLHSQNRGNTLVFFSSFAFMEQAREYWQSKFDITLQTQDRQMDEHQRNRFVESFQNKEDSIYFAVLGGIFSEGLDLKGEQLTSVAVISVGIPPPDSEQELLKDFYNNHGLQGYDFAYRFPGWNRVLQAAGRLIRSEEDRGVLLLIGDRFNYSEYRRIHPENWRNMKVIGSLNEQSRYIERFNSGEINL